METFKDSKGNTYVNIGNLRITYVPQENRNSDKDWTGADVLRIQAYRGSGNTLHTGAEYPVTKDKDVYGLIEAISKLMTEV